MLNRLKTQKLIKLIEYALDYQCRVKVWNPVFENKWESYNDKRVKLFNMEFIYKVYSNHLYMETYSNKYIIGPFKGYEYLFSPDEESVVIGFTLLLKHLKQKEFKK